MYNKPIAYSFLNSFRDETITMIGKKLGLVTENEDKSLTFNIYTFDDGKTKSDVSVLRQWIISFANDYESNLDEFEMDNEKWSKLMLEAIAFNDDSVKERLIKDYLERFIIYWQIQKEEIKKSAEQKCEKIDNLIEKVSSENQKNDDSKQSQHNRF